MAASYFVTVALKGGETFDVIASGNEARSMIAAWDDFLAGKGGAAVLAATCAEGQGQVRVLMAEIAAMVALPEEDADGEPDQDEEDDDEDDDGDDEADSEDDGKDDGKDDGQGGAPGRDPEDALRSAAA